MTCIPDPQKPVLFSAMKLQNCYTARDNEYKCKDWQEGARSKALKPSVVVHESSKSSGCGEVSPQRLGRKGQSGVQGF